MSGLGFRVLEISDGTRAGTVNLLDQPSGFCAIDWRPSVAAPKRGGVWHGSPFVGGRSPVLRTLDDVIETFTLAVRDWDQDALILDTIKLRTLLEKATQYWTTTWQNTPVFIKAQGRHETNPRYSIIKDYRTPEDGFPYGEPFDGPLCLAAFESWPLIITREPFWRPAEPGTATCQPISVVETYCHPSYLDFNGSTALVNCTSNAILDDLHDAAMTVEGWFRLSSSWDAATTGFLVAKVDNTEAEGWYLRWNQTNGLLAVIKCATTDGNSISGLDEMTADDEWHHIAMTWNDATFNYPKIYVDGSEVGYTSTQNRVDAIVSAAARDLSIGNRPDAGRPYLGDIGWVRITNFVRYFDDFTPPARCVLPDPTPATTIAQWIKEGTGATTVNQANVGTADGTITDATWDCDCERSSGNYDLCGPSYIGFNATTTNVNCGSAAALDDLATLPNDMTLDGWVRADGWGENNNGYIAEKDSAAGNGWEFYIDNSLGLHGLVYCAAANSEADSGTDDFTPDSEWHHVAMAYYGSAPSNVTAIIRLWVDGVEVTYVTQNGQSGGNADATANLLVGNIAALTRTWDGDIGWFRVSDTRRWWAASFTVPPRCTVPVVDADTVAIWIYEGEGSTTENLVGTANTNGAITDGAWDCDCIDDVGRQPTCDEEVFIANKRNEAQLTHIFRYDASTAAFSLNLLGTSPPYQLLPGIPAVGDIVYFGIDTTLVDSGPFCSLVFDILTAQTDLTTVVWEYEDGAWTGSLTVQDNTNADGLGSGDPFDTTGVKSVHWEHPSDWVTGTVNTVTGYWVRARVTVIGAAPAPPWQQNRHPYTITWPYIELQAADIGGNIAALAEAWIRNQADTTSGGATVQAPWDHAYCGLRSISRGVDFTAAINLTDEQNPSFITVTDIGGASGAFTAEIESPVGQVYRFAPAAGVGTYTIIQVAWDAEYTSQFYGTYRVFLRALQTSGNAGDLSVQLQVSNTYNTITTRSEPFQTVNVGIEWLEFGQITIPLTDTLNITDESTFIINVQVIVDVVENADFHELWLIPVDEWAGDFADVAGIGEIHARAEVTLNNVLDIDSVRRPKTYIRTPVRLAANMDQVTGHYIPNTVGPFIWQANARQRLWFFLTNDFTVRSSDYFIANTVQTYKTARYLSMRGST